MREERERERERDELINDWRERNEKNKNLLINPLKKVRDR